MSGPMTPVAKDDPLMIAWEQYKATPEYINTRKWALYIEHVDGSLWAAFMEGWKERALRENSATQVLVVGDKAMAEEGAKLASAEHHPSCKPQDNELVWRCNQCGNITPATGAVEEPNVLQRIRADQHSGWLAPGQGQAIIAYIDSLQSRLREANDEIKGWSGRWLRDTHDLSQKLREAEQRAERNRKGWENAYNDPDIQEAVIKKLNLVHADALTAARERGERDCWLVMSLGGEGPPGHMFCYSREDVRHAFAALCYGNPDDADSEELDRYMEAFDNPDEWSGEGTRLTIKFEIDGIEVTKLERTGRIDAASEGKAG
jgi:hypothetical protein